MRYQVQSKDEGLSSGSGVLAEYTDLEQARSEAQDFRAQWVGTGDVICVTDPAGIVIEIYYC